MPGKTSVRMAVIFLLFACSSSDCWCGPETAEHALTVTPQSAARMGRENSKNLVLLRLELKLTRQKYAADTRSLFPHLSVSFSNGDTVIRHAPDSRTKRLAVTVTQPVSAGGSRIGEGKIRRLYLALEEQKVLALEENIEDTAWILVHRIIIAEEKARLKQKSLDLAREKLELAEAKHELGLITEMEFVDTQIAVHNMQIDLNETEQILSELDFTLKKTLSLPREAEINARGRIDPDQTPENLPYTVEELRQFALENSRNLKEKEFEVYTREESLRRVRWSRVIPKLSLDLSFFLEGTRFPLRDAGFSIKISVGFNNPLFPAEASLSASGRGKNQRSRSASAAGPPASDIFPMGDIKTARLALYKERVALEKERMDAVFELEQTFQRYLNCIDRIEVKRQAVALMRKKQEILAEKLALGEIKKTELLSARIEYAEAETVLLEQILELIETGRSIEKTAGLQPGAFISSDGEGWYKK